MLCARIAIITTTITTSHYKAATISYDSTTEQAQQ